MKRILLCLFLLSTGMAAIAQNRVDLTLRYNIGLSRYEVYATPTFSATNTSVSTAFLLGASQISIVLPMAVPDAPLLITSVSGGVWDDNTQSLATANGTNYDFHAVATNGSNSPTYLMNFISGAETLLFTFTITGGCYSGVRLFNNSTDPSSTVLNGGDFRNSFFGTLQSVGAEIYRTNLNNNGSTCTVCNLVAPTLSK